MITSKLTYLGNLRVQSTHVESGESFITDAPKDNNGKGESFSPTDTVANALAACMLTIIGIKANNLSISIENTTAEVTKIMSENKPRRISKIIVNINFNQNYSTKIKQILEHSAMSCPVFKSLHPNIEKVINFNY